jgi:hypothetical protein
VSLAARFAAMRSRMPDGIPDVQAIPTPSRRSLPERRDEIAQFPRYWGPSEGNRQESSPCKRMRLRHTTVRARSWEFAKALFDKKYSELARNSSKRVRNRNKLRFFRRGIIATTASVLANWKVRAFSDAALRPHCYFDPGVSCVSDWTGLYLSCLSSAVESVAAGCPDLPRSVEIPRTHG